MKPLPIEQWDSTIEHLAATVNPVLNIHKMVANNPVLFAAYAPLRQHTVKASTLSPRQRELIILRVAHGIASEYEWTHHVVRGQAAGLTLAEITRVKDGTDGFVNSEAVLLDAADEMVAVQQFSAETLAVLQAHFTDAQQLDIIYTIGLYITLGTILKTYNVPLE